MIDLPAIRRANLQKIRDKRFTSNAELARAIERAPSQVNDMLTGTKSFGFKIARSIEEKLKLPRGYLDEPHELEKVPLRYGKKSPSSLSSKPAIGLTQGTTLLMNGLTFLKTCLTGLTA